LIRTLTRCYNLALSLAAKIVGMTSWYYAIGQQLRGPFDEPVFRDLIRDGTGDSATSCSPFTLSVILKNSVPDADWRRPHRRASRD